MNEIRKITLRNDFHDSETTVTVRDELITVSQIIQAKRRLCGRVNCPCGGIRGPQDVALEVSKYGSMLVDTADGSRIVR